MKKTIELIEKLVVPIILGVLVFITANTSNKIMQQQTQLVEIQNERSNNNTERQLELKYLELFYNDINSADLKKQSSAIGLLRLMNPELGLQLSEWTKMNIELIPETKEKIDKIDNEFLDKLNAAKYTKQGVTLAGRGKIIDAIIKYNEAIKLNPDDFESYNYKGYSHYRLGELKEAEIAIRKSIEINEDFIWAHYNLAIVLWAQGKEKESIDELEVVLSLDKGFVNVINKDVQFNKFKKSERFVNLMK